MADILHRTFSMHFLKENVCILIEISLKFVSKDPMIENKSAFSLIKAHLPGNNPLSGPMMT